MKKNKYFLASLICAIFIILSISSSAQDNILIKDRVKKLVHKHTFPKMSDCIAFAKIGKPAIPFLIDNIDKNEIGIVGYPTPMENYISPIIGNFVGIRSAYIIEYLISDRKKKKMFINCVIYKEVNNSPRFEVLTLKDMIEIKKIYSVWWRANSLKSLEQLQNEWKGKSILEKSNYFWY